MLPVDDETRVDVTPSPSDVSWPSSDGALLVQTVPHNVHFSEPKFTAVELYRLHHARRMHPHEAVLVASHDPSIMVGHIFSKIGKDAVGQVCKEGCSVCNAAQIFQLPESQHRPAARSEGPLCFAQRALLPASRCYLTGHRSCRADRSVLGSSARMLAPVASNFSILVAHMADAHV